MTLDSPYAALIQQYEDASNRHDVEACVALFAEDGRIEMDGQTYQGPQALRDAHEYDLGSRTLVAFRDLEPEGDGVRCTFWNEQELDRVVGSGGTTGRAAFTFRDGKIDCFSILPPDEQERERVMGLARPAIIWLRQNHPEAVARWRGFDRAGGEALFALAELWRNHQGERGPGGE